MEEFGTGRVAASAAVVVGRVPVGEADEQRRVDGVGHVGVTEPDGLATFFAPGAHPVGELGEGVVVLDDDGLYEQVLALQEQLAAGLRRGDGGGGHELGHLSDRVGAQVVVAEVVAHAGWVATCFAHQA